MRIQPLAKAVTWYLRNIPATRDNDCLLISKIWSKSLREAGMDTKTLPASEMLRIHAYESILPNTESIRRSRQKIQQTTPELRGQSYKARVLVEETKVRGEIKNWRDSERSPKLI